MQHPICLSFSVSLSLPACVFSGNMNIHSRSIDQICKLSPGADRCADWPGWAECTLIGPMRFCLSDCPATSFRPICPDFQAISLTGSTVYRYCNVYCMLWPTISTVCRYCGVYVKNGMVNNQQVLQCLLWQSTGMAMSSFTIYMCCNEYCLHWLSRGSIVFILNWQAHQSARPHLTQQSTDRLAKDEKFIVYLLHCVQF